MQANIYTKVDEENDVWYMVCDLRIISKIKRQHESIQMNMSAKVLWRLYPRVVPLELYTVDSRGESWMGVIGVWIFITMSERMVLTVNFKKC